MRSWPALLLAPLTALGQQSICLSLSEYACSQQTTLPLHLVSGAALGLILAMTLTAGAEWRGSVGWTAAAVKAANRTWNTRRDVPRFLAIAGTLVGGLSALVSLLMWMPVWVLGTCMR